MRAVAGNPAFVAASPSAAVRQNFEGKTPDFNKAVVRSSAKAGIGRRSAKMLATPLMNAHIRA
jgi:hypothetical protein